MDISAILPVNMGDTTSSLNDDFSATTPAGDNVFTKPMAARTTFKTDNGGLVLVSFLFDPKQKFTENAIIASVTTDYMAELRDAITKKLLNSKDIAPKKKTLEETIWDQLTSALPKETLAKNVFNDKAKLNEYIDLLKTTITRNYKEEELLTTALKTQKYSFSFEIAIDAYPQDVGRGSQEKAKTDKTGVLTLHLAGIPDGKLPDPVVVEEEEDSSSNGSNRKSKKRKIDGDSSKENKDNKKATEKLLNELALGDFFKDATVEKEKFFPLTANTFFESVNRWFSGVVSRKAAKLEKQRNRNPLYQ